jgi:hypothetical protein
MFTIFAAHSILNGGETRLYAAGFFYACTLHYIYGFVPPCGALMRPLPLRWNATGKAEPFFYSAEQTIICNAFHRKQLFEREAQYRSDDVGTRNVHPVPLVRPRTISPTQVSDI